MSEIPKQSSRRPDGFEFFGQLGLMAMAGSLLGRLATEFETGLWDVECLDAKLPGACFWLNHHAGWCLLGLIVVSGGYMIYRSTKRAKKR
jgi:hypothetical protein